MKEVCSICGIIGYKQQRGNSLRILHYDGFMDGKRHYVYHQMKKLEVNESNSMEVKNLKISSNPQKDTRPWAYRLGDLYFLNIMMNSLTK